MSREWIGKLVYFDRFKKRWRKPAFIVVQAARWETAVRKALLEYREQHMNRADKWRSEKVRIIIERAPSA